MTDPQTTTDVVMFSHSMMEKLHQVKERNVIAAMLLEPNNLITDGIHHITLRDGDQLISFCPKGKPQDKNEDGTWKLPGRQTLRIGRMVRQVLKPHIAIADTTIEDFSKLMQITYEGKKPYDLMLVKGMDIGKWYSRKSYIDEDECEGGGDCSLWQSCMRYEECEKYFGLYTGNPKRVQMLIQVRRKDKALMSRALVWKLDDGRHYLDRIYTCDTKYLNEMKEYAKANGWLYKYRETSDCSAFGDHRGVMQGAMNVMVSGIDTDFEYMPYMDTLRFAYTGDCRAGFIANYPAERSGQCINAELCDTGGDYNSQSWQKCIDDGIVRPEDNCKQLSAGEFTGQWCYHYNARRIHGGRYAMMNECEQHDPTGTYYLKTDLVQDSERSWCLPTELKTGNDGHSYAEWKAGRFGQAEISWDSMADKKEIPF